MKLIYKLFAAFLVTSLLIVAFMIVIMQYYASKNFSAYAGRVEMEQLSSIMPRLELEYRVHHGWDHLRNNDEAWSLILGVRQDRRGTPFQPPFLQRRMAGDDNPPPASNNQHPEFNPRLPAFNPPPHDIRPRLTLFDRGKRPVMGKGRDVSDHVLKEIKVDGELVGWLGLRIPERLSDPLQLDFLYRQTRAFYLIGGAVLALAALLTFIFARNFMKPVRQLAKGAHALSSRQFDTRIDITSSDELGQLSRDFNHMADTLERYEQLRRQWISDISHELRTPISVLLAEIDAVLDGVRDMKRENLESLQAEVLLMKKLVEDLHSLSLLESDTLAMDREEVDLPATVREVLHAFELRFIQAGIAVESDMDKAGKLVITGDRARLVQVFTNLIENSLKYTDAPGTIHISHMADAGEVSLAFDDSPPGVDVRELPYIFERLYRTDRSRTRSTSGSGLGLAICKAIVEAMGGSIKAKASPLGGLRMEIVLQRFKKPAEKNAEKKR